MPTASQVWRDYTTDGVPSSGAQLPSKSELRAWGTGVETQLTALAAVGGSVYATKADMLAVNSTAINSSAIVTSDSTPANNGWYRKTSAAGAGSGTYAQISQVIPGYDTVRATDAGAGTANAIVATSTLPISTDDGAQIVILNVFEANTASPVTVAFNGGTALTIKTVSGADIPIGGLAEGMFVIGTKLGSNFRLFSDFASTNLLEQCLTQAGIAAAEADASAASAAEALTAKQLAQAVSRIVPSTAFALANGVKSVAMTANGSGGTNGSFALAFSGGDGTGATGVFSVSGGAVVPGSVQVTWPGSGYTSAPTVSFAASSGLSGATAVATIGINYGPGEFFSVVDPGDTAALILYENVAGTATERERTVASAALSGWNEATDAWSLSDSADQQRVRLRTTGALQLGVSEVTRLNGMPATELSRRLKRAPRYERIMYAIALYGQSLSLGQGGSQYSDNALPGGDYGAYMFNANGSALAGPRAHQGTGTAAQNHASLVALTEVLNSGSGDAETGCRAAVRMIRHLISEEDLESAPGCEFLCSASGLSNTAISGLSKPSTPYTNVMNAITYGVTRANELGYLYKCPVVFFRQGERDITIGTARATYTAALQQLYTDLNTDIKAATGQAEDIKLVVYVCTTYDQTNLDIALAQIDAADANPNIVLSYPKYQFPHTAANNVHFDGRGYYWAGELEGYLWKRLVVDGQTPAPFRIASAQRQGNLLHLGFSGLEGPIVQSNALFTTVTNGGLDVVDGSSVDNPITAMSVGKRTITLTLTNAVAGTVRAGRASWGTNFHTAIGLKGRGPDDNTLRQSLMPFERAFT